MRMIVSRCVGVFVIVLVLLHVLVTKDAVISLVHLSPSLNWNPAARASWD